MHQWRRRQIARTRFGGTFANGVTFRDWWESLLVGAVEREEKIFLTPHDALRHTSGSAGIKQQQVVASSSPRSRDIR